MKILTSGTVVRGEEDWARNQLTVSVKSERNPSGNWVWYRREGGRECGESERPNLGSGSFSSLSLPLPSLFPWLLWPFHSPSSSSQF